MTTLTSVLNKLQSKGIDRDFRWTSKGFTLDSAKMYAPQDLTIIEVFRFEELKDPGDLCVLYLIEANDGTMGFIIDAYGMYSCRDEDGFDNALRLVPEKNYKEQLFFEL